MLNIRESDIISCLQNYYYILAGGQILCVFIICQEEGKTEI